jgi:hypothetical protein
MCKGLRGIGSKHLGHTLGNKMMLLSPDILCGTQPSGAWLQPRSNVWRVDRPFSACLAGPYPSPAQGRPSLSH